jgi:hypothetical protein
LLLLLLKLRLLRLPPLLPLLLPKKARSNQSATLKKQGFDPAFLLPANRDRQQKAPDSRGFLLRRKHRSGDLAYFSCS